VNACIAGRGDYGYIMETGRLVPTTGLQLAENTLAVPLGLTEVGERKSYRDEAL
jgi:hypothetical protein